MMKRHLPLNRGDTVGVVAVSSHFKPEVFESGIVMIKKWGLKAIHAENLFKRDFVYAGTVKQRLKGFLEIAQNPKVKIIWCIRGGYGSYEVADILASKKYHLPPKLIWGISDATAIQTVLRQKYGWTVVYGPNFSQIGDKDRTTFEKKQVSSSLFDPNFRLTVSTQLKSVGAKKTARGILVGGNLSIVATSIGTNWEVDTDGKILFLEDIGESSPRIDRMFYHLRAAGKFDKIKGLVFGDFTDCVDIDKKERWMEIIKRNFKNAKFPVLIGLKAGHGAIELPVPLGVSIEIRTSGHPKFQVVQSL